MRLKIIKSEFRNSIYSCKFETNRRGGCFAKAGEIAFEMLSELSTGTEQSYRVETGIG
jgi:hypothetical protein